MLIKTAVNLDDLIKAPSILKKVNFIKPKRNFVFPEVVIGPHAIIKNPQKVLGDPDYMLGTKKPPASFFKDPSVVFPKKERLIDLLKKYDVNNILKKLSPLAKKQVNGLVRAHERDEAVALLKLPSGKDTQFVGHGSTRVILKEHNNLKTLQNIQPEAKKVFTSMRSTFGEARTLAELTKNKFVFGESPRLSRHAIKNITKLHNTEVATNTKKLEEAASAQKKKAL